MEKMSTRRREETSVRTKKLAMAGILCAIGVMGGFFSFPILGSRCAPVQHMINIMSALLLGPWYGLGVAFSTSLLRNLLGLGSLMAFPGSMFGALLCGLAYKKTRSIPITLVAEVCGTAILGGLFAYPIAVAFMGINPSEVVFYAYMLPFFISTAGGATFAAVGIYGLKSRKLFEKTIS